MEGARGGLHVVGVETSISWSSCLLRPSDPPTYNTHTLLEVSPPHNETCLTASPSKGKDDTYAALMLLTSLSVPPCSTPYMACCFSSLRCSWSMERHGMR